MRISDWSSDVCSSDLFRRFDFGRIFFGQVAQLGKVLVAEHRIAVERHLGVEHQQFVAVLAFANRERVDFDLLGIGAEECGIKAAKNFGRLLGEVTSSEEHTSELQSLMRISYAVFCLKKKNEL